MELFVIFSCIGGTMVNVFACIGLAAVFVLLCRGCRTPPQPAAASPVRGDPLQLWPLPPPTDTAAEARAARRSRRPDRELGSDDANARRRLASRTTATAESAESSSSYSGPRSPVVHEMLLTFWSTPGMKTLHTKPDCSSIRDHEPHQVMMGASLASKMAKCKLCRV